MTTGVADATDNGTTATPSRSMNFMEAYADAFDFALSSDPAVFLLGEDIADPVGGVTKLTKGLSTKFGTDRVRPTPIAEQAMVGTAVGAALVGMRPVVEIMMMDFLGVCLDQIANHAAKLRYMTAGRTHVPMTLRTMVGGGTGTGAQHSQSLEAWLTHTPGIKVVCPSNPMDAKGLLLGAIFDDDPVVVMEMSRVIFHKQRNDVPLGDHRTPLGEARIVRPGDDVTLVTWGRMVNDSLVAAERLSEQGVSVEIVDLRSLVPLDMDTILDSVARTGSLLVVHSAVQFCGFGAEIASQVGEQLFGELRHPVRRLGAPYAPTPGGPIEASYIPSVDRIVDAAAKLTTRG